MDHLPYNRRSQIQRRQARGIPYRSPATYHKIVAYGEGAPPYPIFKTGAGRKELDRLLGPGRR
jgi:hypothetical protein